MLLDEIGQCPALGVSLEAEWCEPTHIPSHAFCARRRRREQGAACRAPRRSAFYRRFGFVAASKLGIAAPDPGLGQPLPGACAEFGPTQPHRHLSLRLALRRALSVRQPTARPEADRQPHAGRIRLGRAAARRGHVGAGSDKRTPGQVSANQRSPDSFRARRLAPDLASISGARIRTGRPS